MGIDIVEIWFGITYGPILSILTALSAHHTIVAGYYHFKFLLEFLAHLSYARDELHV